MSMAPGTYLKKRREAAGFSVPQLTAALIGLPERIRPLRRHDFVLLEEQLLLVEADDAPLTLPQAALLHRVLRFDLHVYEILVLRHFCETPADYPVPQICRVCGCTWSDACVTDWGVCAWSHGEPDLCTACQHRAAIDTPAAFHGEPE